MWRRQRLALERKDTLNHLTKVDDMCKDDDLYACVWIFGDFLRLYVRTLELIWELSKPLL